jgi:hypothetical protein
MKKFLLSDVENFFYDENSDVEMLVEEEDDESAVLVEDRYIRIPALNLVVRQGEGCIKNGGDLEPDFSLTAIYDTKEVGGTMRYFESDGIILSLYNYLGGTVSAERLRDMKCLVFDAAEMSDSDVDVDEKIAV